MLVLKPNCELCDRDLPPDSAEARICSYECTFCADCVEERLYNVCPNCGGGLERRPVRPKAMLAKHPASEERVLKRPTQERLVELQARYRAVPPAER